MSRIVYELTMTNIHEGAYIEYYDTKKEAISAYKKAIKVWVNYDPENDYIGINEITLKDGYENLNIKSETIDIDMVKKERVIF